MSKYKIASAFISSVIKLHQKAREYQQRKSKKKNNIKYGRSPSLSNFFEETLTKKLSKIYPKYLFYIDYPIRLCGSNKKPFDSRSTCPDIIITNEKNVLKGLIELKIDLGHFDVDKFKSSKREKQILKARYGIINDVVGSSKPKQENKKINIHFPKYYKKILVVVTLVNEHSYNPKSIKNEKIPKSKEYKKIAKKMFGYKPLFLMEETHYNSRDDVRKGIKLEISSKRKEIIKAFRNL